MFEHVLKPPLPPTIADIFLAPFVDPHISTTSSFCYAFLLRSSSATDNRHPQIMFVYMFAQFVLQKKTKLIREFSNFLFHIDWEIVFYSHFTHLLIGWWIHPFYLVGLAIGFITNGQLLFYMDEKFDQSQPSTCLLSVCLFS